MKPTTVSTNRSSSWSSSSSYKNMTVATTIETTDIGPNSQRDPKSPFLGEPCLVSPSSSCDSTSISPSSSCDSTSISPSSSYGSTSPLSVTSQWLKESNAFFSSKKLTEALENPSSDWSTWHKLLNKALTFVPGLADLSEANLELSAFPNLSPEEIQERWDKILFLLKCAYAIQELLPLPVLSEAPNGALHAVLGLVRPKRKGNSSEAVSISLIVQRLIHDHPVELYRLQESTGRLPLHVVCAAPCNKLRQSLVCAVLHANPDAVTLRDDQGIYPLHLACQAGYPFEPTLELLWATAPYVSELPCPCCPPQLLAQHEEMKSLCCSSSSCSKSTTTSCTQCTDVVSLEENDEDDGSDGGLGTSFETVYTVLQSDPYILAFGQAHRCGANS